MRQQKHFFKTKKKDKTTDKELSEVEICNLSNKEVIKIMITKMFTKARKTMHELSENFNR